MPDFNPDAATKTEVLFSLTNKHEAVRRTFADSKRSQGMVVWDGSQDERTLLRAFQTGLAMIRTNCIDEWIVAGSAIFAIIRTMPDFVELEKPEVACGLTYAGNIRSMRIYLFPWPNMPSMEFIIGHDGRFVKATGINLPVMIMEDDVPQRARDAVDPNDACFGIEDEGEDDPPFVENEREVLEFRIPRRVLEDDECPF